MSPQNSPRGGEVFVSRPMDCTRRGRERQPEIRLRSQAMVVIKPKHSQALSQGN